jgi:hypothetical protein
MFASTALHLANLGISMEQARGYVLAHAQDLSGILEQAVQHGITHEMLADIVGGGLTGLDIANHFAAHGIDSSRLGHPEHPEHPEHPQPPDHPVPPEHPDESAGHPSETSVIVAGYVAQLHDLVTPLPQEPHARAEDVLEIVHAMVEIIGQPHEVAGD